MSRGLTKCYLYPLWIVLTVACFFSLFKSTYFELYMQNEVPAYKSDHPLLLILALLAVWAVGMRLDGKFNGKQGSPRRLQIAALCWAGAISLFFVLLFRCQAVCDSKFINDYAVEFMQGNYSAFEQGSYLYNFSFQLGMIAFLELVYRIFGVENYIAFQLINVLAIVFLIFFLQKLTELLFEEKKAARWEAVLSFGMLPLYLYATFIYGDVIGLSLGVMAIYFGVRYLKEEKTKDLILTACTFVPALIVKSNINIFLTAFVIALLLKMLQNKKWSLILWAVGIVLFSQLGVWAVDYGYAARAGLEEPLEGTPKTAWIAMGLQEAVETDNGCGWYNGYNLHVLEENGYDRQAASDACLEDIGQSLTRFAKEPASAFYYFYRKFVSQWNAPDFQALMVTEWYSRYTPEHSALGDFLIYGNGRRILYQIMNFYHLLLFFGGTAGCLFMIRNWRLERAYYLLNIFGGFLFHMIWEAKSRYILGYFVLLLPVGAIGWERILTWSHRKKQECKFAQKAV